MSKNTPYIPDLKNGFGCDQCSNDNVPLARLQRSTLKDGNAFNCYSDACFCSEQCRDEFDAKELASRKRTRLNAAAPDMLVELKRIQTDLLEHDNADAELVSRLERIIAKAEGNNE